MKEARGGVDQGGDGGLVAGNATVDYYIERLFTFDLDGVVRIFGVEIHFEIEGDALLTIHPAFGALVQSAGLTFFDLKEPGLDVALGDDGVAGFSDVPDFPIEGMSDEREGFFQAGVAGLAGFETAAKLGRQQAAADLALERFTTGGGIDDTLNVNGVDAATDAGEADRKEIHDETGSDAGTDDARAGFSAELIETFRQGGFPQGRE